MYNSIIKFFTGYCKNCKVLTIPPTRPSLREPTSTGSKQSHEIRAHNCMRLLRVFYENPRNDGRLSTHKNLRFLWVLVASSKSLIIGYKDISHHICHPGESRDPELLGYITWIPAFAGMTRLEGL